MTGIIADSAVGFAKRIPYAVPYDAIERMEIEDADGEYAVVLYTFSGTRKVIKAPFSFDRCRELYKRILEGKKKGTVLDLIED